MHILVLNGKAIATTQRKLKAILPDTDALQQVRLVFFIASYYRQLSADIKIKDKKTSFNKTGRYLL